MASPYAESGPTLVNTKYFTKYNKIV